MKKKLLSALLSVAMVSALLAGCGNKTEAPAAEAPAAEATEETAEEAFKALQTKMPDYRYVKLKLAYIRMMRGDNKALDDVRTLIESTQNADDLHFGAVMLRKKGETDESLAIHQRLYDENR